MNFETTPRSKSGPWRVALVAAMAAAVLAAAGCTLPFGPALTIERQSLELAYVRSPEPHVEVRATWRVKNTGDRPVTALDVQLPDAKTHGVSGVRAECGGKELAPGPAEKGSATRFALQAPLAIKARLEVSASYILAAGAGGGVTTSEVGFVLPPGDWAPVLLPPSADGPFAHGGEPPAKWDMTVRVPAGFRVYASGRARGQNKGADTVVWKFQQRREDWLPFAAGGEFQEEKITAAGGDVIFWTRQAMPRDLAQRAAESVGGTAEFYDAEFGERDTKHRTLRIIECPSSLACWAVPGAALPGRELYMPEIWKSGARTMDRQLALTWLDFRIQPVWDVEPFPMSALADYAADLAAATREGGEGGDGRQRKVRELIREFDRLENPVKERAVLGVRLNDPNPVRRYAELKSELFFFALEDATGYENLRLAILHLQRLYARQGWRAADLQAAVNVESGKDFVPLFRAWLRETGIPEDFRSRY